MLYLDNAATAPLRPEAWDAMAPFATDRWGNPSGAHRVSRRAKNALEEAREQAAELLGAARPDEIVFTSGGTEADNLAVIGPALAGGGRGGVVTTAVEHEAVLASAAFLARLGCPVAHCRVDGNGQVDPSEVAALVTPATRLVSVMAANNEIGARQPVYKIAEAARAVAPNLVVHTDAVQAFVSDDLTVTSTGADLISLAAHKFGGPKGVGLLYVRRGVGLEAHMHGGGQELGRRSGTHNPMGVAGMVAAMVATVRERHEFATRVRRERNAFEHQLAALVPGIVVNGPGDDRLVQHSHVRLPEAAAETMLILLDERGLCASSGSACQSGAATPSHVLAAMGMDAAAAAECLRFSFGWQTEAGDGARAAALVAEAVAALRAAR